jgi:hypothetical protein
MSKSDTDNFILSEWMVWFFVVLTLVVAWLVYDARTAQAQLAQSDTQHYMLLYRGSNGLHFDCVDEYPYNDVRRMEWNSTDGFIEVDGSYQHLLSIFAVSECNIDNVYSFDDDLFVWRMTNRECELNVCAAHVNRGAFWIEAK